MFDENFQRDGILVFPRLFDPALIERVRDTVHGWTGPIDAAAPPTHMKVDQRRLHMPVRLEGALLDPGLLFHPLLDRLVASLLNDDWLIDNLSVVVALPGAPMMHLHRDHPRLFIDDPRGADLPPYALSLIVPLAPTDAQTGTTAIARASHGATKVGKDALSPPADWVEAHVPLGGAVLMDYRLWHRGLPNRSSRERPILYALLARDWFTDMSNFNVHERMRIRREDFLALPAAHRFRLRRAAAAGLIDDTPAALGATRDARGDPDEQAGIATA